jgi:GH25 family lysozyme M1 (1,4-beta-N-acetylmuramidase)
MWQYSDKGRIDGISGNVDLDIAYTDFPKVIKAAGRNGYSKGEKYRVFVEFDSPDEAMEFMRLCKAMKAVKVK